MEFSNEQIKVLIENKIIPASANAKQIEYFFEVCRRKKLDPFLKHIHMIERKENNNGRWITSYTIQASLDGMRAIAQRNCKIKSYKRFVKFIEGLENKELYGCCEIDTEDRGLYYDEVPFTEYVQRKRDGSVSHFWKQFPQTMIKKVAEESVLRMLAPEDLSGVYGDDEMDQAEETEIKQLDKHTEKPIQDTAKEEIVEPEASIEAKNEDNQYNVEILEKIRQAKTNDELKQVYSEIPDDEKHIYLEKLSTRKNILKANKKK